MYRTNIFACIRVGLPAARVGTVEGKVATYLHPAGLQRASSGHEGVGTEEASLHYPPSSTRLEANPVPLEYAEWRFQISWWRPKPLKWNIGRHRGGPEDERIG